jgi:hypothetical protein
MVRWLGMSTRATLALASLLGTAPAIAAPDVPTTNECLRPAPQPLLPDGTFATHAEMDRARESVFRFAVALEDYRACLQRRLDTAPAALDPARKQDWRAGIGASLIEQRSLSQNFADQLAKFQMQADLALALADHQQIGIPVEQVLVERKSAHPGRQ